MPGQPSRRRALASIFLSVVAVVTGLLLAARTFPGGFDWVYTVMSALASRKHNPGGARWFAGGLALSMALLWPAVSWVAWREGGTTRAARFGVRALRVGVVLGVLVGVERLVFRHLSDRYDKAHEMLALVCFLSFYVGILAIDVHRVRRGAASLVPTVIMLTPLVAIGLSQLELYIDQRDLGWVGPEWRDMGVPFWLSFAFWQWLAAAALWGSITRLVLGRDGARPYPGNR